MYEKKWPKTVEARRKRVSNYLKELRVVSRTLEDAKNSEPKNEFEHRAYQLEAWANIWEARQNGKKSALLHLATGLGKTSVAVFDVMKFRKEHADGDSERPPKVLFVCHQNNILEQAKERFAEFIPEASSQYFQTKQDKLPEADLTFGTFQSLRNELDTFPPDYFDYIIYDEAHHSQADTFSDVVEYFKPKFQLALTATPDRLDDKSITDHFGEPVYSKSLPEAMSEGWLAQVDYHIVFDDAVKEAIENDFDVESLGKLRQLMNVPPRNEVIAKNILEKRHEIGLDDAKTIVFCEDIEHAEEMAKLLGGKAYHSEVSKETQKRRLKNFRNGELQVITTRDMFNEGVDVPDARLIVFLRSTASKTVFLQQLGRGLRKHKGKDTVSVLDFAANIERLQMVEELANEMREVKKPTRRSSDNGILYDGFSEEDFELKDNMREISAEETIAWHGNIFEFEARAMDILKKYKEITEALDRNHLNELSKEEIVELALNISPKSPLTLRQLSELSKDKLMPSPIRIADIFNGSILNFHKACGFDVKAKIAKPDFRTYTNQQIVEIALEISPDEPLSYDVVKKLAKLGLLPNPITVSKRFGGSFASFQKACGFEAYYTVSDRTNDELVQLALRISPDKPLRQKDIRELSKKREFIDSTTLQKRFGSLADFQKACGFAGQKARVFNKLSNDELVILAKQISPNEPLTLKKIEGLSKSGEFLSGSAVAKRFGGIPKFQQACGFESKSIEVGNKEEIVSKILSTNPTKPLKSKDLEEMHAAGTLPSPSALLRRFDGSIKNINKACGF